MGKTIVIDNGGCSIKVGLVGQEKPPRVVPNCIVKSGADKKGYLGDQVDSIKDISSLTVRRPIEKGYIINWDAQREIWNHVFKNVLKVDTEGCDLVITEPLFTLPSIQGALDEVLFGEYRFRRVRYASAPELVLSYQASKDLSSPQTGILKEAVRAMCGVVLDAGFSFTHAVPIFDSATLDASVRRINLGGKALTNLMKELVSFRAWNMMDEYFIIEDVKEKTCYCAQDVRVELKEAHKPPAVNMIRREYVLPDGVKHLRGYVKDVEETRSNAGKRKRPAAPVGGDVDTISLEDQVLPLTNERFMIPEALFQPADIGVNQAGIAEAIVQAVSSANPELHELLYGNVIVCGGCARFPGFLERLYNDLRSLVPDEYELNVRIVEDPVCAAWHGGVLAASKSEMDRCAATRQNYIHEGSRAQAAGVPSALAPDRGR